MLDGTTGALQCDSLLFLSKPEKLLHIELLPSRFHLQHDGNSKQLDKIAGNSNCTAGLTSYSYPPRKCDFVAWA